MTTEERKTQYGEEKDALQASLSEKTRKSSDLEAQIAELEKQLSDYEAAAAETRLRIQAEDRKRSELAAEITERKAAIATAEARVSSMRAELSSLSLMAFGRKKELRSKLEEAQASLAESTALLRQKEQQAGLPRHTELEEALTAKEALSASISARAAEKKQSLELLTQAIRQDQERLETVSGELVRAEAALDAERAQREKAKAEEEARAKAEAETRARIEAEVRAKLEAEAREKAEAEARAEREENTTPAHPADSQRPYIADSRLAETIDHLMDKLETYYPERKVFALDGIDSNLRDRLSALYQRLGYPTMDDMLRAYGFTFISAEAARELRSFVRYTPGNEPAYIKERVDSMLRRMEEYYPDHTVTQSIQNDHKSLSNDVSGLSQWLGYRDAGAMLEAYGFQYLVAAAGRPARDFQPIIDALVEKYQTGPKPQSMGELLFDNSELKGPLKTLQNKATELFGMSLKKYFEELGIFAPKSAAKPASRRAVRSKTQEAVPYVLAARYAALDEAVYGTAEDALKHLEGMNVKQNQAGQVYIFRAADCGDTVTIPYGVDFLSIGAFYGQRSLREVRVSAALTEIPSEAFMDCSALERIEIPEGVTEIGEKAFANCVSLREVTLPATTLRIAEGAFANCLSLREVTFLNPMTFVSADAFAGSAFQYAPPEEPGATDSEFFEYSVDRKGSVTITGFTGSMETVVIPRMIQGQPVTTIGKGAFQDHKRLVEVSMSDYVTTLQGDAFRDCVSLKKIHLSNGIKKLISTSFNGCIGLEEINIPDDVLEIKRGTFRDSPLRKLHIGKGLSSIASNAFYRGEYDPYTGRAKASRGIHSITIDPANQHLAVSGSMVLSKDGKTLLAVLDGASRLTIPDGVETIVSSVCEDLATLSDVVFPDSLSVIGEKAFSNIGLRSVIFGANVRVIGRKAFYFCSNLTSAVFGEHVEEIGDSAFAFTSIVSIFLPATLRTLGSNAFPSLNGYFPMLRIDPANPYMRADGSAFYLIADGKKTLLQPCGETFRRSFYGDYSGESKLVEYAVQEGTTHISDAAFRQCDTLGRIVLPEGLISIGDNAFAGCQNLSDAALPNSVEEIGANAFRDTNLSEFSLGAAVRKIGAGAFITGSGWDRRRELRDIQVDASNPIFYVEGKTLMRRKPDGSSAAVVYFGDDEVVALPDGVSEIDGSAFERSVVQEVQIPSSVTAIGERAFSDCDKLVRLRVGFAEPENGARSAVIYFPENSSDEDEDAITYVGTGIREQYMDCIRVDGSGTVFDFVKYDSLFERIQTTKDKILVATDRLKSAIQLVPLYRDNYLAYLRKNAAAAVKTVIEFDDLSGLNTLAEIEVFTGENIDQVIELANQAGKAEILGYLMNYKNSRIGISEEDYEL